MKKLVLIGMLGLVSCSSSKKTGSVIENRLANNNTFLLTEISTDTTYDYTKENHIKVGGVKTMEGPLNERRFLNALAGPNGEAITYHREGSCCAIKSENGFNGIALLDIYSVTWEGTTDTVSLYINMYDADELKAPVGFTIR